MRKHIFPILCSLSMMAGFIYSCNNPDRTPEVEPAQGTTIEFIGRVDGSNIYKITMADSTVVLYGINNGNYGHEAMTKIK